MNFQRALLLLVAILALTACGKQKTSSGTYEKPVEECVADVVPNEYVMHFKNGISKKVYAATLEDFFKEHVDPHLADIDYTEPEYFVRAAPVATATATATASGADNYAAVRVGADALWSAGFRGQGVVVAVIDSGTDLLHPQLAGRIHSNTAEIANNGIDDDANGYIDDARGYDFYANRPLTGDYQSHGTHVAGIVAAEHTDTVAAPHAYVQGLAPAAKIMPLAFLNADGSGRMSDGVRAIKYAAANGARVINASWGGTICSKSLRDTIRGLDTTEVIFVAAAGNDGSNIDRYKEYPASLNFAHQLTVGATGEMDLMTSFSNYGYETVHIFAPGQNIVSTVPGNSLDSLSGTSMAAPVVSGALALLLSAEPSATVAQVRQALYNTAYKQPSYFNSCRGRLDLRTTLTELRRLMSN